MDAPSCSKNSNEAMDTETKKETNVKVEIDDLDNKECLKKELEIPENEIIETHLDVLKLHSEPIYAEICSFLNMFGSLLNIKPISFSKLDNMFCTLYNGEGNNFFM